MELRNVCKSYGDNRVLESFSCSIPSGSVCAVMAPSGKGKTTLLRLILGLEKPDSGEILDVPDHKSALFQEDRLCPGLSIIGNLRMAVPHYDPYEAECLLNTLGLQEAKNKPAQELSGGMARRAALLRTLLCPSNLLVLDEPFTGLDEENRLAAAKAIQEYRKGRTLIFVTHREDDLPLLQAEKCILL